MKKVIFILGAGFTKAFYNDAPLLEVSTQDLNIENLLRKYENFPKVRHIIKSVQNNNKINIEELLTRLSTGTPFDDEAISEGERKCLLEDISQTYFELISKIKIDEDKRGSIEKFSKYIIDNDISCVTFNYDTLLDEYMWKYKHTTITLPVPENYFHPDGGYGFFMRRIESLIEDGGHDIEKDNCNSLIYKLHGSSNWLVKIGSRLPYTLDNLIHYENWLPRDTEKIITQADLDAHLEKKPFIVAPVLDKSEINDQSILKFIWSATYKALLEAEEVVFIGYSLPKTDIAAKFLFKETINRKGIKIVVVSNTENKKDSYSEMFTNANLEYHLGGAVKWIENNIK